MTEKSVTNGRQKSDGEFLIFENHLLRFDLEKI